MPQEAPHRRLPTWSLWAAFFSSTMPPLKKQSENETDKCAHNYDWNQRHFFRFLSFRNSLTAERANEAAANEANNES